jgi:hypothetical protein
VLSTEGLSVRSFWRFLATKGVTILGWLAILIARPASAETIALWLFDEFHYPTTVLTDAGPSAYDLRLFEGRLIDGKFGRGLQVTPGMSFPLFYDNWPGIMCCLNMRGPDGAEPSGLWGPTITPAGIVQTLASGDWTIEFWMQLKSVPESSAGILDLGQAAAGGFSIRLADSGTAFEVGNAYNGEAAHCPTAATLRDQRWHHVAFCWSHSGRRLSHFVDGRGQRAPRLSAIKIVDVPKPVVPLSLAEIENPVFDSSKNYDLFRRHRFNLSVGNDRQGTSKLNAVFDELHIADEIRYPQDRYEPESLSRNYGSQPPAPAVPSGPPLLFADTSDSGPKLLGARKHVFIDDVLVEQKNQLRLTANRPVVQPAFGIPSGDNWFVDHQEEVWVLGSDGYDSAKGRVAAFSSKDGVHFSPPEIGLISVDGSPKNNVVIDMCPSWGGLFYDRNPTTPLEERFKYTAAVANRGVYLYTSPDLCQWRRNETLMLPLYSGGGAETHWDDQRGCYVTYLKRDGSFQCAEAPPAGGRTAIEFRTTEIHKPWPFHPLVQPYYEAWPYPAVTGEGPIAFAPEETGDVNRTHATKYPWAPDVYLAFIWRMADDPEKVYRRAFRQTQLAVSRDGIHWQTYGEMYLPKGLPAQNRKSGESLVYGGLIRRGDEIWQYGTLRPGGHDDLGSYPVRLTQRLDGFVSLDAGAEEGYLVTKPFVFEGERLVLNTTVRGSASVALLDGDGSAFPGFDLKDCLPIQGDSTTFVVHWRSGSNVRKLQGRTVRMKIVMREAKLFAMQFVEAKGP